MIYQIVLLLPSIQFDLILSSKRKFCSKELTHRLMKTSLSMQEEIEWVGGWKKHWTLEITFYVEMVWSINCDEQSLIWQYRNCWNDVFRKCIKSHDILLLHKFEKEYLLIQLKKNHGNISKTADFIGMERSALHRKLKSLGIKGIN